MSFGITALHYEPGGPALSAMAAPQDTSLAVAAGRAVLQRAAVRPTDLDLVVLAASATTRSPSADAAAEVQARLRAHHAEAVLLGQGCASGVASFDIVAGKLAVHPAYQAALIITASLAGPGGAAAAIAVRGHTRCRWLATAVTTDGRHVGFSGPEPGTPRPPASDGQHAVPAHSPAMRSQQLPGQDACESAGLAEMAGSLHCEVLERACRQAGVSAAEVTRTIDAGQDITTGADGTDAALAAGHPRCAAQLHRLQRYLTAGELQPGDIVALTTTASSTHRACTLLRI